MSGNVHVRLREKVDGNGLVVPHSRLQWGLLFFFWGVCQYDLNEVRGFASDIRWAFLCGSQRPGGFVRAINPSGRRRLVQKRSLGSVKALVPFDVEGLSRQECRYGGLWK
ncbi:hypothetical protein M5K25_028341 [Dendrobium thyrsiflorum]|uniref:Uncharacterized protein n=1 Tax=Dendrobium thyrsiflorum TaxID=117978 RepID=A0ABD0TTG1_DENTH